MAGYMLKVLLEDTHPPVWRRIIVPEKITFADLHEIIGTVFGWDGSHLHDFVTPSRRVTIGSNAEWEEDYDCDEQEILVDHFWDSCKWVRYTYDFGDDWKHKVTYEKTDEDYHGRTAFLVKAKGDNFREDCGGVMSAGGADRIPLDYERTNNLLARMSFPERTGEELQIPETAMDLVKRFAGILRGEWSKIPDALMPEEPSLIKVKSEEWRERTEEWQNVTLMIGQSKRTNEELLEELSLKEAKDYCKYLQITDADYEDKKDMIHQIARIFREHPEYLLYVFLEDEYTEFRRWSSQPCGEFVRENPPGDMPVKAIALGLMDVSFEETYGHCVAVVSFAADLQEILKPLKNIRPTYRWIKSFSDKFRKVIVVYGMIEMDALYEIFCRTYKERISREDFRRFIYWHARFNNKIQTMYTEEHVSYAALVPIEVSRVFNDQVKYADGLDYRIWTRSELKRKAEDVLEGHPALGYLYEGLIYGLRLRESEGHQIMNNILEVIQNGYTMTEIFEEGILPVSDQTEIAATGSLWENLAGSMLDMEIPMLKGRSRKEYADLKKVSPWSIQMILPSGEEKNTKGRHIWEFPVEIQEKLYNVRNHNGTGLEELWEYAEKEQISSEEFLFLLADTCMLFEEEEKTKSLIGRLKKSSDRGKEAAEFLMLDIDGGDETPYRALEDLFLFSGYQDEDRGIRKPYVRPNAKIGRNDPCPCGSGKKYKKCCGRNK